jgi:hypothetical protein
MKELYTQNVKVFAGMPVCVYLPEFLQRVDLLGGGLACAELLLLRGELHQPGQAQRPRMSAWEPSQWKSFST